MKAGNVTTPTIITHLGRLEQMCGEKKKKVERKEHILKRLVQSELWRQGLTQIHNERFAVVKLL